MYAINKRHAAKIAELYCSHGVNAVAIDCDTPKDVRNDLICSFKKGNIKVLVNVDIFTEGFDCPSVSFIQLARPTKSLALYIQQVGRGVRIVAGKEKTIILDNVGLYNYFGLPDADRKWQYHFNGHEDVAHEERIDSGGGAAGSLDFEFDESRFNEDDEKMLVVRGAQNEGEKNTVLLEKAIHRQKIKEFSLCDYYLVRGTAEAFKVYPFVKKRGKTTEAVGNCVFEYDSDKQGIAFGEDVAENKRIVDGNIKLQSLLSFVAMLAGLGLDKILDVRNVITFKGRKIKDLTLFELLERISSI